MPGSEDKELIKNVRVNKDQMNNILVSSVCQRLQEQGFNVAGMRVSYYSPIEQMYIFVGKEPILPEKDGISVNNLTNNRLTLKFRPGTDNSPKTAPPAPSLEAQPSAFGQIQGKKSFNNSYCRAKHWIFFKYDANAADASDSHTTSSSYSLRSPTLNYANWKYFGYRSTAKRAHPGSKQHGNMELSKSQQEN